MLNTLKTTLGFLGAVLQKYTPLTFHGDSLEEVYNYLQIDERIATSGQPTEAQFRLMPESGYLRVINLAPQSVLENSLTTEPELLAELGIELAKSSVQECAFKDEYEGTVRARSQKAASGARRILRRT